MSDIIRLLPDSVANQIAAGEVIQRPASVVKELVENAVDAGATEIQIVIKDAGRTLIQVVDNGKGMTPTDARLAFERHATSKITDASDLFALHTMGFRGEALPSICAISQVELRTMAEGAEMGTRLIINASKVESQQSDVCSKGCNIMVKNLFFNTPARRKFLKSDTVELAAVMREFERLALVNNNIRISLDAGSRKIDLRAATFKQRIADIWKNNLNLQLIPIDVDTSIAKISGFVSRPEFARRRNPLQYFIVNGRNMRHPYFHKAIVAAYEGLIAQDTMPCYFIKFEVDPQTIDVNIHPTKQEIKFENEQTIWPILSAAVKAALGKYAAAPSIDFTTEAIEFDPAREGDFVGAPTQGVDSAYNPFLQTDPLPSSPFGNSRSSRPSSSASYSPFAKDKRPLDDWERLYTDFMNDSPSASSAAPSAASTAAREFASSASGSTILGRTSAIGSIQPSAAPAASLPGVEPEVVPICVQFAEKYILSPTRDGVLVIDQYRAHMKILYERFMKASAETAATSSSQRLMFPEIVELDATQSALLESVTDELRQIGFLIEKGEGDSWRIMGVPALLGKENPREVVMQILALAMDFETEASAHAQLSSPLEDMLSRIALAAAKSGAVKGGQKLSNSEMEHIISELFSLPDPMYTPEGNPILRTISASYITSLF